MKKERILIQLDEKQLAELAKLQEKTGAARAEIIRRAITLYLEREKNR
jgi:metal-responsive CopG/Arc/MetJ family transcriptional regulator